MERKKRIGILTGGGDVPGLNSVIKTVVYRCTESPHDYDIVGIRRGWEGLTNLHADPRLAAEYVMPLDRGNTRTIDRTGGTCLHTSRTNPAKMDPASMPPHLKDRLSRRREFKLRDKMGQERTYYDVTAVVQDNLERLQVDHLIAIGGDDTLSYAAKLHTRVLVRIHSECFTGDVFGARRCDCGEQLQRSMELIAETGTGVIIYMRQECRGIGLLDKLRAYNLPG